MLKFGEKKAENILEFCCCMHFLGSYEEVEFNSFAFQILFDNSLVGFE